MNNLGSKENFASFRTFQAWSQAWGVEAEAFPEARRHFQENNFGREGKNSQGASCLGLVEKSTFAFADERKSGEAGFKCRNCGSQKIFAKQTKTG